MKIEMIKISELIPYENNPRLNKDAVERVARSISDFGFQNPIILDENFVIIAGHTRHKAAINLGLEEVPCIVAKNLSDEQVKSFRIADNKTSEFADWDIELLITELEELDLSGLGIDTTGFDLVDLEKMKLQMFEEDEPEKDDDDKDDDKEKTGIIQYNIIFNTEVEQTIWQEFLLHIKNKYDHIETISERLVQVISEVMVDE